MEHEMAYIPYVPYEEARSSLKEFYRKYGGSKNKVDNIIRIHSKNPLSMKHHFELYAHLMRGPSPLTRIQREMIAIVVSACNDCFYWINHHGAGLRKLVDDEDLPKALVKNYKVAILSRQDRAMLDYAAKLTVTPADVEERDVVHLKELGFDDTGVLDICQVTAYYNYVNRLADGLGVELEQEWKGELVVTEEEMKRWMHERDSVKGSLWSK